MNRPILFANKSIFGWLLILGFFTSTSLQSQTKVGNHYLESSTPEAEGVASEGITRFIDALESENNEMHSFVILRHGKIISEAWWSPYAKDLRHVMFSVSKSFTSIAVGIAISENKLKLTDKVHTFFPESAPANAKYLYERNNS